MKIRQLVLVLTISCGAALSAHFRAEDDLDVLSDVSTSVRCSKSKLSVTKAQALYTWEVDGFLSYLRYLRDFGAKEFRHSTSNIIYDSEKINGEWSFELRSTGNSNFVTATYTYQETKDNQNGNFGIKLKILQPNYDTIQLPIQKPTNVMRERVFVNSKGKDGNKGSSSSSSSYLFSYPSSEEEVEPEAINTVTFTFDWPAVPTEKLVDLFQFDDNTDLIFTFMIQAYFPAEAKTFRKTTCSLDQLETKYFLQNHTNLLNSNNKECSLDKVYNATAMFHDSKFADLILQVESVHIPVHSVILYHSSSIIASLILNATQPPSNNGTLPVIHFPDEIGYNGTMEILRYIYTGKVERLTELASKIIIGAERFHLPGLKSICEQSLISSANLSNVIKLYVLGIDVSSSRLVRKAFAVIQTNRANIVSQSEEFRKLSVKYPNLMFELFVS